MLTVITFIFVAAVKCDLYQIKKNNRANATHGPSPVQKNVPRPNRSD